VFLLAVITRRGSAIGALVGLVTGAAVTFVVAFTTDTSFYLYAVIGCVTCLVVGYLVSLFAPNRKPIDGLQIHHPTSQ
jgi:Na+/proline symporter